MTDTRLNLVVIGSGMTGGKLVEEILLRDNKKYTITVIGEEPYGNYDRIRLAELVERDSLPDFWFNSDTWYHENGVNFYPGTTVSSIDYSTKQVATSNGSTFKYDRLVFATGSNPYIPPIANTDLPCVMTLRNLEQADELKKCITEKSHILLIGGGILGLELAVSLVKTGVRVTVSHLMCNLMEQYLSPRASDMLLKKLKENCIEFMMNSSVVELQGDDESVRRALFSNGSSIDVDAVVINTGITPRIDLALKSGLRCDRGILVNEHLQTSKPDIYAVGECTEFNGKTWGLVAPLFQQVRVLADFLTGNDSTYQELPAPPVSMKYDYPVITMGQFEERNEDTVIEYSNPMSCIYKKLVINDSMLMGANLVGDNLNADAIRLHYTARIPVPANIEQLLFPGAGSASNTDTAYWPDNIDICECNGIKSLDVKQLIKSGVHNPDDVIKQSRAGSGCGTCKDRVRRLVEHTWDAIVIGSGLGGLTSGACLAKHGKRVLVIEQHDKAGGYATSFQRDNFVFDVSLHNFGPLWQNKLMKRIFNELELNSMIDYIPYDNFQTIQFPDHKIVIEKGIEKNIDSLIKLFPAEEKGIRELYTKMVDIRSEFDEIEESSMDGKPTDFMGPMISIKYPNLSSLVFTTFGEMMDEYISDPQLKGIVGNLWWYYALPPEKCASILYTVPTMLYYQEAGGYIKGTSQRLSNALASTITDNGGEVLLNTKATRIFYDGDHVGGVMTSKGQVFYSDTVISNAGAHNTYLKLFPGESLKKKTKRKVTNLVNSLSGLQLYIGLKCHTEELGFTNHSISVFYDYDHTKNYQYCVDGEYEKTFFSYTNYTRIDPSLAPQGQGIISMFSLDHIKNWDALSESEYRAKKERVTEIMLDKLEKMIPGIREHIEITELGTPKTMARYALHPDGMIFGQSQIVEQSGMNRFTPETDYNGLYLVGAAIYPGAGYPSVITSGFNAGITILQQMKAKEPAVTH
jgi:phytoene desaturase